MKKLRALGPGLLYAGAAIGVSHLVQSTRAGAVYGFTLVWAVVIANLVKYPFFEFGPRYAAATGKSLLHGYKQIGNWALVVFALLTIGTMFVVEAAILSVTAGLAENIFNFGIPTLEWAVILLTVCLAILLIGKYSVLDNLVKYIVVILSITTVAALISSFFGDMAPPSYFGKFDWNHSVDIFFLIALMGWMPAPMDISIWHSVWSVAKSRSVNKRTDLKDALFDFNVGFIGTAFLAMCFLSLGAMVFFGQVETLSSSGLGFAKQLIDLYTASLGGWAHLIISIAAFTTMFSTALTCLDAFPRVLRPTTKMLLPQFNKKENNRMLYNVWIGVTAAGALLVILFLMQNMRALVDFATTLSFLTTPILAWLNYRVVFKGTLEAEFVPGKKTKWLSQAGLVFLFGFTFYYLFFLVFS